MIISLIVAAAENNAIGKNNDLLWSLPNDMKFFKNTTWSMPVIMGRKTFESMGSKSLKGRFNIIVTRQPDAVKREDHVRVASSLNEAIAMAKETDCKEAFIAGGGEIYKEALPLADKIFLTRVHASMDGDTFFPDFNKAEWKQTYNLDFNPDEKHAYAYSFQVWERLR